MYQRLLVATDGSELSAKAVDHAIALAKVLGAELVAFKAALHRVEDHWDGGLIRNDKETAEQEQRAQAHAQAIVDGVKAQAEAAGVKAQALTVRSNAVADAIVEAAGSQQCDLIVMASHGRRGITRVLIGSETQHVLTHSQIPVLVLR